MRKVSISVGGSFFSSKPSTFLSTSFLVRKFSLFNAKENSFSSAKWSSLASFQEKYMNKTKEWMLLASVPVVNLGNSGKSENVGPEIAKETSSVVNSVPVESIGSIPTAPVPPVDDAFFIIRYFLDAMQFVHDGLGIPWWGTIVLVNVIVRLAYVNIYVKNQRNSARLSHIAEELKKERDNVQNGKISQMDFMHITKNLYESRGVDPFYGMRLVLFQSPVMITFFFALNRLALHPEFVVYIFYTFKISVINEKFLWVASLGAPDPIGLPILVGSIMLLGMEIGSDGFAKAQMGKMIWAFRVLIAFSVYMTSTFPATVALYFATNQIISTCLTQVCKIPAFRAYFNIPIAFKPPTGAKSTSFFSELKALTGSSSSTSTTSASGSIVPEIIKMEGLSSHPKKQMKVSKKPKPL